VTTTITSLVLTIPGEPTPKGRPRLNRKTGTVYTPQATTNAESAIGWEVKRAASEQGIDLPFAGPVRVRLVFRSAVGATATVGVKDGDNCEKLISDALNAIAWNDDRQVVDMHWTMVRGSDNPGVDIEIEDIARILMGERG
jgi:crossover junction endodeoxyribonuclease RusA